MARAGHDVAELFKVFDLFAAEADLTTTRYTLVLLHVLGVGLGFSRQHGATVAAVAELDLGKGDGSDMHGRIDLTLCPSGHVVLLVGVDRLSVLADLAFDAGELLSIALLLFDGRGIDRRFLDVLVGVGSVLLALLLLAPLLFAFG